MGKKLFNILRLLRPRQWIKNFAIFAAIIFGGALFNANVLQNVIIGFFVFCGISSATYVINDIFDVEKDKQHPFKRFRPLPKGEISKPLAWVIAAILVIFSLTIGALIGKAFFILIIVYLALQFSYSFVLKGITVVDILAIALGYILRVYAGEFSSGLHISVWLLLTTISLSLFIAIGKRRSELTLLSGSKAANIGEIRKSLSHYSDRLLDVYTSIFATSTFIAYSLFTFLQYPAGFKISLGVLMPEFLPNFFERKWLMLTIIPVVYGLMRYMQDIYEKNEGESPEKVLLSDKPLLFTVIAWAVMVVVILYFVGA